jgi:hypothetical protein
MTDPKDAGPVEQELPDEDLDVVTGGVAGVNDPVPFVPQTGLADTNGTFSLDPAGTWTDTAGP